MLWAVQKWLNRLICHWVVDSGGLKEAQIQSVASWHLCALIMGMQLNCLSAAMMRPYVKLLWSLVIVIIIIIGYSYQEVRWWKPAFLRLRNDIRHRYICITKEKKYRRVAILDVQNTAPTICDDLVVRALCHCYVYIILSGLYIKRFHTLFVLLYVLIAHPPIIVFSIQCNWLLHFKWTWL